MYYTIYKIINLVNGKHYIGAHKTTDLDDGYMGSSKHLSHAKAKYGIENFTKEILFVFDSSEEMFNKEKELVNEEFVARTDTYNLKVGGFGGFDYINELRRTDPEQKAKHRQHMKKMFKLSQTPESLLKYEKSMKELDRTQIQKKVKETKIKNGTYGLATFKGKTHTQETKDKIGKAASIRNAGKGNSQYGTCWICNLDLEENKRIQKTELDEHLSQGWTKGRIYNFGKHKENEIKKKEKLQQKELSKKKQEQERKELAYKLYNDFMNSDCTSVSEFYRESNFNFSDVFLRKLFFKYIESFRKNSSQGQSFKKSSLSQFKRMC